MTFKNFYDFSAFNNIEDRVAAARARVHFEERIGDFYFSNRFCSQASLQNGTRKENE